MQSHISAARLEGAEAEFMYQYESMAPRSAVTSLGIVTARIGGVVLSMRNDVTGYWNKALGFGFAEIAGEPYWDETACWELTAAEVAQLRDRPAA